MCAAGRRARAAGRLPEPPREHRFPAETRPETPPRSRSRAAPTERIVAASGGRRRHRSGASHGSERLLCRAQLIAQTDVQCEMVSERCVSRSSLCLCVSHSSLFLLFGRAAARAAAFVVVFLFPLFALGAARLCCLPQPLTLSVYLLVEHENRRKLISFSRLVLRRGKIMCNSSVS